MPSTKKKLQLLSASAALLLLAGLVGCTGFFQNPVLTTLTVGPQAPNIQQGSTLQMSATGTYDDGSTKTLTSGVFWSSSDDTIATISTGGKVTAGSAGTATITASSGAVSGTSTVTVSLNNVIGLTLSPTQVTITRGSTGTISALATVSGMSGTVDVSATTTWTITDSTGATPTTISITSQQSPATITVDSSATPGTYTITAVYSGTTTFTKTAPLTVN
jgi:Bacterial Ig-like domain (group 2)